MLLGAVSDAWPRSSGSPRCAARSHSMSTSQSTRLRQALGQQSGDARKDTDEALVVLLDGEFKRRVRDQLRGERADSLQPTRLVHDIYDRLLEYRMPSVNREHFLAVAATAMRRAFMERARRFGAVGRVEGRFRRRSTMRC